MSVIQDWATAAIGLLFLAIFTILQKAIGWVIGWIAPDMDGY